ncbi:hypothetical protein MPER_04763, partial [Moniliophthora perniciosa FA553]
VSIIVEILERVEPTQYSDAIKFSVQRVSKFNRTKPDEVKILMALYRVEEKPIDLVVTFNVPVIAEDGGAVGPDGLKAAEQQFDIFVRSLRIVDFALFA